MNKIIRLIHVGDLKLFYIFNDGFKCNVLDKLIPLMTSLGGAFFTITTSITFIVFGGNPLKIIGWQCLATLASSHIFVHYLKKKFTRPRPFLNLSNIHTYNTHLYDYSFPSGHTTAAFSIAAILSFYFSNLSWMLIGIAFIVGFSRVYIGVHYPSDVLVGMVIGTLFAIMNYILLTPWLYQVFYL
ncbi:MAG: phosphatase PAP2 family protein [Thermotaleaceae bacterium]